MLQYEYLVVAAGLQIDWDKIKGLKDTIGRNGVVSIYDYQYSQDTWEALRNLKVRHRRKEAGKGYRYVNPAAVLTLRPLLLLAPSTARPSSRSRPRRSSAAAPRRRSCGSPTTTSASRATG